MTIGTTVKRQRKLCLGLRGGAEMSGHTKRGQTETGVDRDERGMRHTEKTRRRSPQELVPVTTVNLYSTLTTINDTVPLPSKHY